MQALAATRVAVAIAGNSQAGKIEGTIGEWPGRTGTNATIRWAEDFLVASDLRFDHISGSGPHSGPSCSSAARKCTTDAGQRREME